MNLKKLFQTTVQDLRYGDFEANQIAQNWDVILPSNLLISTLVNLKIIKNHK